MRWAIGPGPIRPEFAVSTMPAITFSGEIWTPWSTLELAACPWSGKVIVTEAQKINVKENDNNRSDTFRNRAPIESGLFVFSIGLFFYFLQGIYSHGRNSHSNEAPPGKLVLLLRPELFMCQMAVPPVLVLRQMKSAFPVPRDISGGSDPPL